MKSKRSAGPFEKLRVIKAELEKRDAAGKKPAAPPATSKPASGTSKATAPDDDALLLHRMLAGVKPMDRSRGRVTSQRIERSPAVEKAAMRSAAAAAAEDQVVRDHLRELVDDRGRFEVADDGSHVEGRRVDLPVSALRRLRRGELPVDGRIDLHGMVMSEARPHLDLFVRTMRSRGERCVLVIHGKGKHSPGGVGVLRGEIAAWLSQGPASEHVAAFATARDDDGGEGAVYVLLRK